MAFVAEDGTGLANSNSLVSVAFADTYFTDRDNQTWLTGTTLAQKEISLIKATDYLENVFSYKGSVLVVTQALEFPRTGIYIRGVAFSGMPIAIEEACAELAVRALSKVLLPDPTVGTSALGAVTERFIKAGPVEKRTKFDPNAKAINVPQFPSIKAILIKSGLLSNIDGGVIRI